MTFVDKNASAVPHDPEVEVKVQERNAAGRPVRFSHVCTVCNRLVTGSPARHV